ncbi:MAG: transglycosylase domain-containing protein [Bacteroidales bacterium]|nr:transglycosylase domain-containing protein [Bacteroidales bacterium]
MRRRFVLFLWSLLFLFVLVTTLAVVAVERGWIGNMPDMAELQNPINKFASQAITSDGRLIGTWSRSENRVFVPSDSIAPHLYEALIATEDERFYDHSGIDAKALGRAIIKRGVLGQKQAGGGSTITQQLAKQLYSEQASTTLQRLFQKPIEWVIAVELERYYTKEEIMTLYLNYFDFLHNAVGIKTAANVYFGKSPRNLTLLEAATLVGMCKNPSYFNPVRNAERCRERRNVVLAQMVKTGRLSAAEYTSLKEEPVKLNFHRIDHKEGQAPYLREYLRRILMADEPKKKDYREWQMQQYYVDSIAWATDPLYGWCKKNKKRDGSHYDIYTDGLKVYTSIDSRMQRYAEEAVFQHVTRELQPEFNSKRKTDSNFPYSSRLSKKQVERILQRSVRQSDRYRTMKAAGHSEEEIAEAFSTPLPMTVYSHHGEKEITMTPMDSIRYYKSFLRAGLMSIEPTTGLVKAYVGGLNYAHFQYDMAMAGRRQIGSTMKPFVFSLAMEDGYRADELISNAQRTYRVAGRSWTPRNANHARAGQMVTLRWGLSQSSNWVTANLMNSIDPTGRRLVQLLHTFGVHNPDIHPSMALCLGPCDVTVGEMASAYTAFVNKGIRCAPILVTRIEDSEGNVVAEFHPRMNEVISEQSSFDMIEMLQAVVNQGTGKRLRYKYKLEADMAGKTGTTNENADGWFVGFVPRLVTACWVGGEDRDIHFNSTSLGQGASTALPIWALYMTKIYHNSALGYRQDEKFFLGNKIVPDSAKTKKPAPASEPKEEEVSDVDLTIFN